MAVVTKKSTYITNRDATPTVPTGASVAGGVIREATGYVAAVNGDSATSVYTMASMPSNVRVNAVRLTCEALGAGAKVNCGVYWPTSVPANIGATAGSAIAATLFASALDVSAALAITDITNQSGNNTIDKQEMELWQAAGLATDPGCMLDISVAVNVAIAANGKIGVKIGFVQ
jgi:hypothetical protein